MTDPREPQSDDSDLTIIWRAIRYSPHFDSGYAGEIAEDVRRALVERGRLADQHDPR